MILSESSTEAHSYLWLFAFILFLMFIMYTYACNHQMYVYDDSSWVRAFKNNGISDLEISKISHDYSVWYYDDYSTCVAYGDWDDYCEKSEYFCPGSTKVGSREQQAGAIAKAIEKGGYHPYCPLI